MATEEKMARETIDRILEMSAQGKSNTEISRALGVPRTTVLRKLRKYGGGAVTETEENNKAGKKATEGAMRATTVGARVTAEKASEMRAYARAKKSDTSAILMAAYDKYVRENPLTGQEREFYEMARKMERYAST